MRDTSMREDNLRAADEQAAETKQLRERLESSSQETVKGASLLNSGALIAMLGFSQSLIKATGWCAYKPFALAALLAFFVGAIAGPVSFALRTEAFRRVLVGQAKSDGGKSAETFLTASFWAMIFSLVVLAVGAFIAGFGIYRVF